MSVRLSVCQTITFESLDVESSFSHIRYISTGYGSSSYMKVIGSRSRSQEPNKQVENSYSRNVKLRSAATPVLSNIELWCLHVACMVCSTTVEWCDHHLCHVTGSDHAQLNALIRGWSCVRLEGSLVKLNVCQMERWSLRTRTKLNALLVVSGLH